MIWLVSFIVRQGRDERSERNHIWVHKMLRRRKIKGEFATLHCRFIDDEIKFYKYSLTQPTNALQWTLELRTV
jgi:hypothetical protein